METYVVWNAFDGSRCYYSNRQAAENAFEWLLIACLDEGLEPYQMIGVDIERR